MVKHLLKFIFHKVFTYGYAIAGACYYFCYSNFYGYYYCY